MSMENSAAYEVQKCLALLEEGSANLKTGLPDVILILGMTGAGKTTLAKLLTTASSNNGLKGAAVTEGSGEFTIIDEENKIGKNTIVSQTVFPELYVDQESGDNFYDCPGFSDTRGMSNDIAGTYFTQKIITESKYIRFVLCINYSSVRHGVDRRDFLELLRHVLNLVKNVDAYLDSFALVVTKVDNQWLKKKAEHVLVSDESVIEIVVKFLNEFKNNIDQIEEGEKAANMSKLVNVFLQKSGQKYEKIALLRRPDEAGPVYRMTLLQENKKVIKKVVRNNLSRTEIKVADFGLTISEESKNNIHYVINMINDNIGNKLAEKSDSALGYYENLMSNSTNIYDLQSTINSKLKLLRNRLTRIPDGINLKDFLQEFQTTLNITSPSLINDSDKNYLQMQNKYLSFLEEFQDKNVASSNNSKIAAWKSSLQKLSDNLSELDRWFSFLLNLSKGLSDYSVRSKLTQDFIRPILATPIENLSDPKFIKLLELCKPFADFTDYQSLVIDQPKVQMLNKILPSLLTTSVSTYADPTTDTYEIRGNIVTLSDYFDGGDKESFILSKKFITVFASEKLFINTNITRKFEILSGISFVAPVWEVIGDVHINLNGLDGCCTPLFIPAHFPNGSGNAGSPGVPGKSAANFFGFATSIINEEHLKITANGGRGSAGQDGTDGLDGPDGESPIVEQDGKCYTRDLDSFSHVLIGRLFKDVYCIYGKPGANGGNGGDGGAGGVGGSAGDIKVIKVGKLPNVKHEMNKGQDGKAGAGGVGGKGGKVGKWWHHYKFLGQWGGGWCEKSRWFDLIYGNCNSDTSARNGRLGLRGRDGGNYSLKTNIQKVDNIDTALVLDKYKQFLNSKAADNSLSGPMKNSIFSFIDSLKDSMKSSSHSKSHVLQKRWAPSTYENEEQYVKLDGNNEPIWIPNPYYKQVWPIVPEITQENLSSSRPNSLEPNLTAQFPVAESLLLTDFIIRRLNKSKFNYYEDCSVDYVKTRQCAADFLSQFENILQKLYPEVEFDLDPVAAMEALEKEIINGKRANVEKILIQLIQNGSSEKKAEIQRRIQNLIHV